MQIKRERKSIQVPLYLWEMINEEANASFDTLTTTLKNILLARYKDKIEQNKKKVEINAAADEF